MSRTPPSDEDPDRRAILLRRAAFLAGALATLVPQRQAHAAGDEVPCPRQAADAAGEQEAVVAMQAIEDARSTAPPMSPHEQALRMEAIYAAAPSEARAVATIDLLLSIGDPDRAYRLGEMYQVCQPPSGGVRERLDDIARRFARVALVPSPRGDYTPTHVAVGERSITYARFLEGAYVDPAATQLGIQLPNGRLQNVAFTARAGELTRVQLPTLYLVDPMPCLSPPPPPTIDETLLRFGAELAVGPAFLPDEPLAVGSILGPRLAFDYRLGESFRLESALQLRLGFGPPLEERPDEGTIFAVLGTEASVLAYPVEVFGFGAGMCAGYVFAPDDPTSYLQPSPFIGFVATPVSIRTGPIGVTLRLPFGLADTSIDGAHAVRMAWIAPEASLSGWFDLIEVTGPRNLASR